jgi:hypothetical protein
MSTRFPASRSGARALAMQQYVQFVCGALTGTGCASLLFRLSFEAPAGARASSELLEKRFAEIALRDTRVTRLLTIIMSCIAYTIAVIFWPGYPMYPAALAVSLASLLAVLWKPRRANAIVSYVFLPASACAPPRTLTRSIYVCVSGTMHTLVNGLRAAPQCSLTGVLLQTSWRTPPRTGQ